MSSCIIARNRASQREVMRYEIAGKVDFILEKEQKNEGGLK
jgi:hypothetical protein